MPFGTVVRKESPLVEAFVNDVISPMLNTRTYIHTRIYVVLGMLLGRRLYILPILCRYGIRYPARYIYENRKSKDGKGAGDIERRISGTEDRGQAQPLQVPSKIPINGGILHGY